MNLKSLGKFILCLFIALLILFDVLWLAANVPRAIDAYQDLKACRTTGCIPNPYGYSSYSCPRAYPAQRPGAVVSNNTFRDEIYLSCDSRLNLGKIYSAGDDIPYFEPKEGKNYTCEWVRIGVPTCVSFEICLEPKQ